MENYTILGEPPGCRLRAFRCKTICGGILEAFRKFERDLRVDVA